MTEADGARMRVRYEGRVQGVGFRFRARSAAAARRVSGFVQNEPDGSVTLEAEGPKADLLALLRDIRTGPLGAHVLRETVTWIRPAGDAEGFEIRF